MSDNETKPQDDASIQAAWDGTTEDRTTADAPAADDRLAALTAERDLNRENWLRAQAEFENYRRRSQKEAEQARLFQSLPLARDLLPGLDNLRRAIAAAESTQNVEELIKGVRMVADQFDAILARHEVKPIESVGQPFDPNLHEAIQQAPSADHPPMTVLQEAERGYTLHDRVIRPSRVIVSRAPE